MAKNRPKKQQKLFRATAAMLIEQLGLTDDEVVACAVHEVLELLLCEMHTLARRRYISEDALTRARHRVIRRLERVFLAE